MFVENRAFKREGERNVHMLHYEEVFGNDFERRESKCCTALLKQRRKVKGEQVITRQISMLYQENYFVVNVKLNFC